MKKTLFNCTARDFAEILASAKKTINGMEIEITDTELPFGEGPAKFDPELYGEDFIPTEKELDPEGLYNTDLLPVPAPANGPDPIPEPEEEDDYRGDWVNDPDRASPLDSPDPPGRGDHGDNSPSNSSCDDLLFTDSVETDTDIDDALFADHFKEFMDRPIFNTPDDPDGKDLFDDVELDDLDDEALDALEREIFGKYKDLIAQIKKNRKTYEKDPLGVLDDIRIHAKRYRSLIIDSAIRKLSFLPLEFAEALFYYKNSNAFGSSDGKPDYVIGFEREFLRSPFKYGCKFVDNFISANDFKDEAEWHVAFYTEYKAMEIFPIFPPSFMELFRELVDLFNETPYEAIIRMKKGINGDN